MASSLYRTRKLDSNGDIVTSGTVWLYDIEAVAQTINTRLNLFAGEFWRDVTEGTPWTTKILGKNNQSNTLQSKTALIRNRVLNTPGVVSILSWDSDFDYSDRKFSITGTVLTEFGSIDIDSDLSDTETDPYADLLVSVQNYVVAINGYTEI